MLQLNCGSTHYLRGYQFGIELSIGTRTYVEIQNCNNWKRNFVRIFHLPSRKIRNVGFYRLSFLQQTFVKGVESVGL